MYNFILASMFLIVALAFSFPNVSVAERGSGSDGDKKIEDSLNSFDDDGTPDQGRGDFDALGNRIIEIDNDDGTPDQGRGDFDALGNPTNSFGDSSEDDDGTPDQGRGNFDAQGNPIVELGDDDGTSDQGKGDFFSRLFGQLDDSRESQDGRSSENESESHSSRTVSSWFMQTFSWWF